MQITSEHRIQEAIENVIWHGLSIQIRKLMTLAVFQVHQKAVSEVRNTVQAGAAQPWSSYSGSAHVSVLSHQVRSSARHPEELSAVLMRYKAWELLSHKTWYVTITWRTRSAVWIKLALRTPLASHIACYPATPHRLLC